MESTAYTETPEQSLDRINRLSLTIYERNMMIKMLSIMRKDLLEDKRALRLQRGSNPSNTSDAGSSPLLSIPKRTKKRWNLDGKHILLLKDNLYKLAKETITPPETEGDFARLLLSEKYLDTEICEFWRPAFPFAYGKSIEEVAAEPVKTTSVTTKYTG